MTIKLTNIKVQKCNHIDQDWTCTYIDFAMHVIRDANSLIVLDLCRTCISTYLMMLLNPADITEVNLFAFVYILFREDFSSLIGTDRQVKRILYEAVCRQIQIN